MGHFARLGFDGLRLHLWDRELTDAEGNLVDNEHLRPLDYLVHSADGRGIWVVLTPSCLYKTGGQYRL